MENTYRLEADADDTKRERSTPIPNHTMLLVIQSFRTHRLVSVLLALLAAKAGAKTNRAEACKSPGSEASATSTEDGRCESPPQDDKSSGSVPNDLLQVPISSKAYIGLNNYTSLGVSQLYDPDLVHSDGEPVSLSDFRMELDDSITFVGDIHQIDLLTMKELTPLSQNCILKDERCLIWALKGFCGGSQFDDGELPFATPAAVQSYMAHHCCPVCDESTVDHLDYLQQCPLNPASTSVFTKPGQVTTLFLNMLEKVRDLSPRILAAPVEVDVSLGYNQDYKLQPGGPWVVTFDDFVSDEEAAALRKWGAWYGYQRSGDGYIDASGNQVSGEVPWRTSTEAWCKGGCLNDILVAGLWDKLEAVTRLSRKHSDYLQLLKYVDGQFYSTHQDYHKHQAFSTTGARVVTFYMYLNGVDDIQNGGGTNFPYLNVTVYPKRGRALVWSNVRDDNVNEESYYARHQALPVEGTNVLKYSATAWFHQREIQTAAPECWY